MMNKLSYLIDENTMCISDTHFGHSKVTSFEPVRLEIARDAGYSDWEELAIDRINAGTGEDKTLLVLGDFAFKAIEDYSNKLIAKNKVIILGNHDRKAQLYRNYGWHVFDGIHYHISDTIGVYIHTDNDVSLLSGLVKRMRGMNILFSHYPVFDNCTHDRKNERIAARVQKLEDIYKELFCCVNIHGHVHSRTTSTPSPACCVNVSCEVTKFIPVSISDIIDNVIGK